MVAMFLCPDKIGEGEYSDGSFPSVGSRGSIHHARMADSPTLEFILNAAPTACEIRFSYKKVTPTCMRCTPR